MPRLAQVLGYGNFAEPAASITWAATVVPDASLGRIFKVTVPTTSGVAIAAALNPGPDLILEVFNSSGAASMTPPTFDSSYLISAGAFAPPTVAGKARTVQFVWDGAKYVEVGRSAADL